MLILFCLMVFLPLLFSIFVSAACATTEQYRYRFFIQELPFLRFFQEKTIKSFIFFSQIIIITSFIFMSLCGIYFLHREKGLGTYPAIALAVLVPFIHLVFARSVIRETSLLIWRMRYWVKDFFGFDMPIEHEAERPFFKEKEDRVRKKKGTGSVINLN